MLRKAKIFNNYSRIFDSMTKKGDEHEGEIYSLKIKRHFLPQHL